MFRQSHPLLSAQEMQLLEDMLPPEQYDVKQLSEQDLSHQLYASWHHVMAEYQAFTADGVNTGQPLPCQQTGRRAQQHKTKHGRKRQHRQRHDPFLLQHPFEGVGTQQQHDELCRPGLLHLGNPEGRFLDAVAAPQLWSLESLQEPSSYGAYQAVYAAMAACSTAAATTMPVALPPYPDPSIGPANHFAGLHMAMPSTTAMPSAACEGQGPALPLQTQRNSLVSMRPTSLSLDTRGMSVPGSTAVPETGLAKPSAPPAHQQGQPQANSLECDFSNIPVTPSGQFLLDLLSSLKKRMDPSSSSKSPFKDIQEVAGAVSHLPGASAGAFQTCSPTQFSGSNLAQVSLPLLKRNQPDALAFEQLLQTGVLVKDLYLSAGQQSDCHVFGLVSPRSPGSSKAWHHKHNQNSHDLPAGTLKNWKHRASPVDVKPVGPGSKPPPANADSFDQPHAVLQVKSEGAVCQPGSCIPLDLSNILGCNWDGGLPQSSAGGAPSALTVELPNSHLPTASTVNPQSLHAEITGVEEVLAEMGVVAGDRGLMSAIVSGQNGLLAAVAAKLAATPATSVEGFCARVQGSQQFSNAAAQGGVTAEAHAAAFPADQPHHHNPAKERQKHMMCLDLRSPCSKVAAAVAAQEKPPEATSSLHHACHAARPTVINHAGLAVSQQQATKLSAPSFGAAALAAAEVVTASCVSACQMVDPQTAAAGTSFVSFKADVTTAQCKNPSSPDTADASKVAINTEVSGSNKAPMPAFVEDHPPAAPLHPDPADISRQHTAGTSVTAADPGRPAAQSSSSMGPRGSPASEAAQLLLGLSAGQQAWMGTARCLPWPPQQQRRRRKLGSATLTDLPTGMISADVQDDLQDTLPVQCAAAKLGSINTSTSYQVAQQRVIAAATSFMHSFESIQPPASISASPPGALSPPCPASGDIHQQQQSLLLPLPLPRLTHLVPEQKNAGVMDPESTGGTQQDVQTAPQASSDPVGGMQDLAAALIAAAAAASVVSSNAAAAPSAAVVPAVLMHPSDNSSQGQKQQLALQQQQPAPLQYQQLTQTDDMLPDQPAAWQPVVRKPKRKAGLAAPAATSAALLPDDVLQFLASQGRGDVDSAGLVRVALGLRPLKDKRSSLSGGGAGASLMPQAYSGQKASAATAMGRGIPAAHSAAAVRTGSSKSANLSKATPGLAGGVSKEAAPSCAVVRKQRPTPAATSTAQDTISNETGATLQDKQLLQAPGVPATGMTWNGHAETAAETADMPFTNESHSADGEGHQGQQQKRKHHSSKQLHSKVQGGPPAAQLVAQASGHGLRSRTGTPASKTAAGLDNCSGKTLSRVLCSAGGRQQATANGCERHPSMTAVSSRTIKRRHSCKVIGSRAVHAAEPSHNTHDSFAPTQQQPQRRHSMPASAAALPAAAADPADLVASFVRAGQLPPRRAAARAAAAVAAAVAASSDADVERLDANDHENQQQIDGTTLGPDCTDFDSDGLACRTQGRGKGRTSASGGAAGSARQKRGKPQLSDGARIKRGRLSSGPAAVAAATATPTAGAGAGAVGAGSYGSSGSGNSGGLGVHDRVLANRLAAARSYLRKKEEIARLEIATGNLQVEKTAGQQKLQLVEDLVQLHAQLQVLLQDHATSPESKLFPADAVGVLLQCNHLTN